MWNLYPPLRCEFRTYIIKIRLAIQPTLFFGSIIYVGVVKTTPAFFYKKEEHKFEFSDKMKLLHTILKENQIMFYSNYTEELLGLKYISVVL